METVSIGARLIGRGQPCFIIAEAGVNHNGDLQLAKRLIDVAASAGADAVKFQSFRADQLASNSAPKAQYQLETTDNKESQLEMLRGLELSQEAHYEIQAYCLRRGTLFVSTPFDCESADLLESLDVPFFKVSSGDLTNLPLLEHIARKRRPIILSTGMSHLEEVEIAVETLRNSGAEKLILLHCVSNYPAAFNDINLRAMQTMEKTFSLPVGYSDHTLGIEVPIAAVALGACVIEKHLTLDKTLPGPDHRASLEPQELEAMIKGIRHVEASLGSGIKAPSSSEIETARVARRSLFAVSDISAGTKITRDMISLQRPGTGLAPAMLKVILGRTTRIDIAAGSMLTREMFE